MPGKDDKPRGMATKRGAATTTAKKAAKKAAKKTTKKAAKKR
ncbi:MAG: hypothetical protein R2745_15060 [Vicinamibacterales bacterium]